MPSSWNVAATRRANKAAIAQLAASVRPTCAMCDKNFSFSLKTASELCDDERAQIWQIFEENMHELYRSSSFGWDTLKKKREMFHRLSRLVVVRDMSHTINDLAPSSDIVAYSIFRFESGDRQDVVYCYELQVAEEFRRFGLGRLLTQILSDIGAQWGMSKIMLSVFKENHTAMRFYQSTGFTIDDSMTCNGSEGRAGDEMDYTILSRRIP